MGIERKEEYVCDNCKKKFTDGVILQNGLKNVIVSDNKKKFFELEKTGMIPDELCYCIECYAKVLKRETKANCIDETILNVKEQKVVEEVTEKIEKIIDKKIDKEVERIREKEHDFQLYKVGIIVRILASLLFSALFVTGFFLSWHWGWFIGFGVIICGVWMSFLD